MRHRRFRMPRLYACGGAEGSFMKRGGQEENQHLNVRIAQQIAPLDGRLFLPLTEPLCNRVACHPPTDALRLNLNLSFTTSYVGKGISGKGKDLTARFVAGNNVRGLDSCVLSHFHVRCPPLREGALIFSQLRIRRYPSALFGLTEAPGQFIRLLRSVAVVFDYQLDPLTDVASDTGIRDSPAHHCPVTVDRQRVKNCRHIEWRRRLFLAIGDAIRVAL